MIPPIFRCAVASLYEVVSVCPSIGPSVGPLVRLSHIIFEQQIWPFLDVTMHLYKRLCASINPSIGPLVCPLVRPSCVLEKQIWPFFRVKSYQIMS